MIRREDQDDVTVLTLHHGKANALDLELCLALDEALGAVEHSPSRAIVLTGEGPIFSAGVDLPRLLREDSAYTERFVPALAAVIRRLFVLPKPVVAAVGGHAIAGGCLLVQAADRRLLADGKARLGVPELKVGVPFPTVGLEVLRFQVGDRVAQDLACSGRTVLPADALALGLVDQVVEPAELLQVARAEAAGLAAIPAPTFGLTKRQLRRPVLEVIDRDAAAFDAEVVALWADGDVRAAVERFVERTLGRRGD
ncbi:MAG: enoyl-CoA hydratase/isomerase family protein [Planctomycetota bacterium]|jgi:enoyl-CoA hydratase